MEKAWNAIQVVVGIILALIFLALAALTLFTGQGATNLWQGQ